MRHCFHSLLMASAIATFMLCASCSREPELTLPVDALARVGGQVFTQQDLDAETVRRAQAGLTTLSPLDLLNHIVRRESLLIQARSQGLHQTPELQREFDRILISRLRDQELTTRYDAIVISDDDLMQAYADRVEQYTTPSLTRMAMLFLKKDKNVSAGKRLELHRRMNAAKVLADQLNPDEKGFGELSVSFSDDTASRYRGGDIGWINERQATFRLPEDVFLQTHDLQVGVCSEIIETDEGLYLTMRTDERAAVIKSFDEVRMRLKKQLQVERRNLVEEMYHEECLLAADVQMNEENIARLEAMDKKSDPPSSELPVLNAGL